MSSNYYQLYIEKVLQLAATIVIKSEATAQAQNRYVNDYHTLLGIDAVSELQPSTWKYYRNLAGEYHPADVSMTVVSMDTLEEIVFSKANLQIHRATSRGYQYGTRQYKELVAKYPTQERLILGILYPVDINKAIAARDGEILGYPQGLGLVEPNEYNLINRLQEWIDRFRGRWVVEAFKISDELYAATYLGVMYLHLVPAIINARLAACKTNEAHSFHVRQYLGSHGLLDAYVDTLTLKQSLFFYRNIAYIERHAGQREIFQWLVEHIMTERGFPLAEYVMQHDLSGQPTALYPELKFQKNAVNEAHTAGANEELTLLDVLIKEDSLARDNATYRGDYDPVITSKMQNSRSNLVLTKLLESSMIDYSNSNPHTLEEVLLNEWVSQAADGTYHAYVGITNPRSGEWVPLTVKEAFIFVWYAFCKSFALELEEVPEFFVTHVQRTPLPTASELLSVVDQKLIDTETAELLLEGQPTIGSIISIDAFYELCVKIHDSIDRQRALTARQEHYERRGYVHAMCKRIYTDRFVRLAPANTSYETWFETLNIPISDLSAEELKLMHDQLLKDATGLSLHETTSVQTIQRAMIRMLGQLSSYSIQITSEINTSELKRTDWPVIRIGTITSELDSAMKLADVGANVQGVQSSMVMKSDVPVSIPKGQRLLSGEMQSAALWDIDVEVKSVIEQFAAPSFMRVATVAVTLGEELAENDEGIIPVPGYEEHYLELTSQQRQALRDIYNSPYLVEPPAIAEDLSQVLEERVLDGLLYIPPTALRDEDGLPLLDEEGDFIIAD